MDDVIQASQENRVKKFTLDTTLLDFYNCFSS